MTQFTQREFLFLDDLLHAENLAAAKCRSAASCASDPQIRQLFEQLSHAHQQHFNSLLRYMNSERSNRPAQWSEAWQSGPSHYTPEANWQQNQSGYQSAGSSHTWLQNGGSGSQSWQQNAGSGGSWQQNAGSGSWQQNAGSGSWQQNAGSGSWQPGGSNPNWQQGAQPLQPQSVTQPVSARSSTLTQ